jgi:hypothetical protein
LAVRVTYVLEQRQAIWEHSFRLQVLAHRRAVQVELTTAGEGRRHALRIAVEVSAVVLTPGHERLRSRRARHAVGARAYVRERVISWQILRGGTIWVLAVVMRVSVCYSSGVQHFVVGTADDIFRDIVDIT